MTDPTPTRAEVERITTGLSDDNPFTRQWCRHEAADAFAVLAAENQALRERAEAAEAERAEQWRQRREAEAARDTALAISDTARRAEAAAWNEAIEAAAGKLSTNAEVITEKYGAVLLRTYAAAIRALRRAAPTEDR